MQYTAAEYVVPQSSKPKTFQGERLKWAREQKAMSQEELSILLDIGVPQIWRYETGKAEPLPAQLVKIAKALDVTIDWLLGLTSDAESSQRNGPQPLTPKQKLLIAKYESGELEKLAWEILQEDLDRKSSPRKNPASDGA